MRTLTSSLTSAQKLNTLDPLPRITLSLAGEDDIVLERDRIRQIPSHEESEDSQTMQVVLDNADGTFTDLDLQGWTAVIEWGLVTSGGNEYSACAPLVVMAQTLSSDKNALLCYLSMSGIPDLLSQDKASKDYFHHKSDTKTVKDMITEIADGQPVETELTEEQTTTDGLLKLDGTGADPLQGIGSRISIPNRTVTKVAFKLQKYGAPTGTNVVFRIEDMDANVLVQENFAIASIPDFPNAPDWCEVELDPAVEIDEEITWAGNTATGGVYIYVAYGSGDATNYVSVAYNSSPVKPNEWITRYYPGAGFVEGLISGEDDEPDGCYRYKYTEAGIDCFDHCEAYEVVYDSEDSLIDTYLPKDGFKIYENDTRLATINKLLAYTGCVKRAEDDGKIHVFVPTTTGTSYDYEYSLSDSDHKFFSKSLRDSLVIPNRVVVHSYSDDTDQYTGNYTSAASYALLPKSEFIKAKLVSNAQATALATARIAQLEMAAQRGNASVPLNVGAEVHDYIKVTDSRASDSRAGNIGSIRRSYNPNNRTYGWLMGFSFGKTAKKPFMTAAPSELAVVTDLAYDPDAVVTWGSLTSWWVERLNWIWYGGKGETEEVFGIYDLYDFLKQLYPDIEKILNYMNGALDADSTADQINEALIGYQRRVDGLGDLTIAFNDVTASRAVDGTVYQNTSGGLMFVQAYFNSLANTCVMQGRVEDVTPPTLVVSGISIGAAAGYVGYGSVVIVVPNNYYYCVAKVGAGTVTFNRWVEVTIT